MVFGRKKANAAGSATTPERLPAEEEIPPMPPELGSAASRTAHSSYKQGTPMPISDITKPNHPETARRGNETQLTRLGIGARTGEGPDPKTLFVGREIGLNGEITACDRLVVEGQVEASLKDCQAIEIGETGLFKGDAEVRDADIRGRFEGKLTVHGRLMVRSAGKISGELRYGQLEIECGGQIVGQVEVDLRSPGGFGGERGQPVFEAPVKTPATATPSIQSKV